MASTLGPRPLWQRRTRTSAVLRLPYRRIKIRIESLSDLVFGLALSIGSLILVGRVPQSGQDLATNVLLFGFGFLIVVLTWLLYSRTMSVLSAEVPLAMLLNLLLLFCVALEPYLYYVVQSAQPLGLLDAASVAYALDVGGMFFLLAALAYLVVREDATGAKGRRHLHPAVLAGFRRGLEVGGPRRRHIPGLRAAGLLGEHAGRVLEIRSVVSAFLGPLGEPYPPKVSEQRRVTRAVEARLTGHDDIELWIDCGGCLLAAPAPHQVHGRDWQMSIPEQLEESFI